MTKDDEQKRVKLAQLVVALRDELPAHIEIAQLQARITRAKFLALVKEGFAEDQALRLCLGPSSA